jgi:acyl carrier protein
VPRDQQKGFWIAQLSIRVRRAYSRSGAADDWGWASHMSVTTTDSDRSDLHESVRATVEGTIIEVVGRWYYEECDAGLDSTFAEDIELESMEVMEIAERLIETYEGKVDFVSWFSEMDFEQLIVITIGDVVNFIVASLQKVDA